ncbi:MAG: hypothetical protein SFW07_08140 [Gammaproteobacteria bacterium]|nr:hypothetical protein [Gammaproteobacteria bacterium]
MQELPPQRLEHMFVLVARHLQFFQQPNNIHDVVRAINNIVDNAPAVMRKPQKGLVS